ncbi:MAG: hypothetical protein QOE05_408, partial [Actinomycetota bacterium]|nr:hypothetical protein [Actinomycetota bacterium]
MSAASRRLRPGLATLLLVAACSTTATPRAAAPTVEASAVPTPSAPTAATGSIPPALDPRDIYAAGRPGRLAGEALRARALVYVPNSEDDTVSVIDQQTRKVIATAKTGRLPQHVTPSYDLRTLYVDNDKGNSLTRIDPLTGRFGATVDVDDPYNLYFTADGRYAVVVAEARQRLDFYDAKTWRLVRRLPVSCRGVDHLDFSADGTHALVSCEFHAKMIYVDMQRQRVAKEVALPADSMPQDVKLSPDGR